MKYTDYGHMLGLYFIVYIMYQFLEGMLRHTVVNLTRNESHCAV